VDVVHTELGVVAYLATPTGDPVVLLHASGHDHVALTALAGQSGRVCRGAVVAAARAEGSGKQEWLDRY
jgi:hypothetical protein